jgi:hypothetical protein
MSRANSIRYHILQKFDATQIVANGGVNLTVEDGAVPRGRMVSRVFLRVRTDLLLAAVAPATIAINSAAGRLLFNDALVSQISASMKDHPLSPTFIQSQSYGRIADQFARLGVFPTSPEMYGEGQYNSELTPRQRNIVVPGAGNQAHFATLELPIIDQRYPGAGTSLFLGAEQLDGLGVNMTFGAFTFTELGGNVVTIPNGTGGAAGVTAVDLVAESLPVPGGGMQKAFPPLFARIQNGTTSSVVLNPEGGAIASAVVRIPTIGAAGDSLDRLIRDFAFTVANNLQESAETEFSPTLIVDGNTPKDQAQRGLQHYAGLDLINAQATAVATAHQLRATNASTVGDSGIAPAWYHDGGVPIVWCSPDSNFFAGLSCGKHQVLFPNAWTALGAREIFVASFPSIPGADDNKVTPPAAVEAGQRAGRSAWSRIKQYLGVRA